MLKQGKTKQRFKTGAQRDTADGKPRPDLISPFALMREGAIMKAGADHYGERNYEAGMPISRCVASCMRHLLQYIMGDRSEDHMAQLRCNTAFIIHYEECIKLGLLPAELDDMPKYLSRVDKTDDNSGTKLAMMELTERMAERLNANTIKEDIQDMLEIQSRVTKSKNRTAKNVRRT